jgi:hypothetical protein
MKVSTCIDSKTYNFSSYACVFVRNAAAQELLSLPAMYPCIYVHIYIYIYIYINLRERKTREKTA